MLKHNPLVHLDPSTCTSHLQSMREQKSQLSNKETSKEKVHKERDREHADTKAGVSIESSLHAEVHPTC